MSKLVVEVCRVDKVEDHPNADKMKIATVKGWKTTIRYNPETGICQFKEGDLCIFFPPDAILPKSLYDDRLKTGKYLHELPKDVNGIRPEGRRVVATRLRGFPSYGVITEVDPNWGDDTNWVVGTDLVDHFGITKYEPPLESTEGDGERPHRRFHTYTSIENFGNYPNAISEGEEVVMTEKIHGKNCRVGLVLDSDESGVSSWKWMAGSHGVQRREFVGVAGRIRVSELECSDPKAGDTISHNGKLWKIEYIVDPDPKSTEQVQKVHVHEVNSEGEPVLKKSEYWEGLTQNVKDMLTCIKDTVSFSEDKESIIVYGEIYGAGVQDMTYGLIGRSFRVFDIAINNKYLDHDIQISFCKQFNVETVPLIYRGLFSIGVLEQHTNGPTTVCEPEKAGKFKGREGVVVKPVKETSYSSILRGRKIIKSVSADYLARKDGTEFH